MKSLHTKNTKLSRSPLSNLRALCVTVLLLGFSAIAQEATQKPPIICDHAAPPPGMHYVCKSQCDCHLKGKLKNDDDGVPPTNAPKVCSYNAPKPGDLLVCDSECQCKPYVAPKKKPKKRAPSSTH
jgi:hypothetical protein